MVPQKFDTGREGRRFDVFNVSRKQLVTAAAVLLLVPSMGWGAGFAIFEFGARSASMGGAFTAVADDPSALYWNPAGLAFQQDNGMQLMVGGSLIAPKQDFVGQAPYPGDGYTASQKNQIFPVPHAFFVLPVDDRLSLGFGVMAPFGLGTWWNEDFAGRFISKRSAIQAVDTTATIAWRATDWLALSVGGDFTTFQFDLTNNIGFINPYTQKLTDVGQVHLSTDGLKNSGFGWNISALAKLGAGFSAGVLYRSTVDITIDEAFASFTQFPTGYADFDAVLASQIPFGQKVTGKSGIELPDLMSLGLAWENEQWTISLQYNWQGWSSFQTLDIEFPDYPHLSQSIKEGYTNANAYRVGAEHRCNEKLAFQLGFVYDETPQPRWSMSPLLVDGDRKEGSIGMSYVTGKMRFDFGYTYLVALRRATDGTSVDGYDGEYRDTTANIFNFTFTYQF